MKQGGITYYRRFPPYRRKGTTFRLVINSKIHYLCTVFLIAMTKTKTIKIVAGLILMCLIAMVSIIYVFNARGVNASADRCFESIDSLPKCETGVLLGTSNRGCYTVINPYFRPRIDGILDLYRAGKMKRIYITGDSASVD